MIFLEAAIEVADTLSDVLRVYFMLALAFA